jgi:hypothetical protein
MNTQDTSRLLNAFPTILSHTRCTSKIFSHNLSSSTTPTPPVPLLLPDQNNLYWESLIFEVPEFLHLVSWRQQRSTFLRDIVSTISCNFPRRVPTFSEPIRNCMGARIIYLDGRTLQTHAPDCPPSSRYHWLLCGHQHCLTKISCVTRLKLGWFHGQMPFLGQLDHLTTVQVFAVPNLLGLCALYTTAQLQGTDYYCIVAWETYLTQLGTGLLRVGHVHTNGPSTAHL